jgi:ABC-2 type transport system permease protein
MSGLRQLYELARRDFLQRARSRAFLISMLITIGLVLTIGPLISLTTREPDPSVIGFVGAPDTALSAAVQARAGSLDIEVVTRTFSSATAAEQALDAGDADVLVIDGSELVWRKEAGPRLSAVITGAFTQVERQKAAAELGLSAEEVGRLLDPLSFSSRVLQEPDPEDEPRRVAAYAGLMVLYISILVFGQFVLMGVMEEKQNRVVEVVLSRVRPRQVLAGKVMGIGLLGLIQVVALGGAALFMLTVIDIADVDLGAIGIEIFIWVLLWYLLGYSFYSVLYGALGATISRQEDMQGVLMLPVLLILPGFFFGQIATESPDALLAKIGSLFPLWAPMVMPVRSAVGDVPVWEVALSVALLILGTWALIRLGARIYTGAILKIGTKVKLREAWRAARG